MKLLHVDSSILGDHSVTRTLTAAIVARYREQAPDVEVIYRDLAAEPLGHFSSAIVGAAHLQPELHSPELKTALEAGSKALDQFLTSDVVVIGAPMYNFSIPSVLKEWIDRLCIAGKTFKYGAGGKPEGLAGGRKVIIASGRGGVYSQGAYAAFDHQETLLKNLFTFLGITDIEVIRAEGVGNPEQKPVAIEAAKAEIAALKVA